jgi:hypothetical protein
MPKKCSSSVIPTQKEELLAKCIADIIAKECVHSTGYMLPTEIADTIVRRFSSFMMHMKFDFEQCRKFVKDNRLTASMELVTGTGAAYPTRLISEALREIGSRVTGNPHGGGLGGANFQDLTWFEFMTCDRFACFSDLEVSDYGKHVIQDINPVEFPVMVGLEPSVLDVRPFDYGSFDFGKVKNIMHISMGTWYDEVIFGIPSDLQHLDLQMKIIDYFLNYKDKNYIFKIRPKSRHLGMDYDHLGYYTGRINYENRPLEEVLDQADMFVAEYIGSSALWEAMTHTDKPIILFKPILPDCYESFHNSVGKRCFIIDQIEDSQNRLGFDTDSLNRLLRPDKNGFQSLNP